jgi:hypothetical protein
VIRKSNCRRAAELEKSGARDAVISPSWRGRSANKWRSALRSSSHCRAAGLERSGAARRGHLYIAARLEWRRWGSVMRSSRLRGRSGTTWSGVPRSSSHGGAAGPEKVGQRDAVVSLARAVWNNVERRPAVVQPRRSGRSGNRRSGVLRSFGYGGVAGVEMSAAALCGHLAAAVRPVWKKSGRASCSHESMAARLV